jgi:hypothetical protein
VHGQIDVVAKAEVTGACQVNNIGRLTSTFQVVEFSIQLPVACVGKPIKAMGCVPLEEVGRSLMEGCYSQGDAPALTKVVDLFPRLVTGLPRDTQR